MNDGRAVKAASEAMTKLLERTHASSNLAFQFAVFEGVLGELQKVLDNAFFQQHLAGKLIKERGFPDETLGALVKRRVEDTRSIIVANQPALPLPVQPTSGSPRVPFSTAEQLRQITPEQKIGPVQFEMVDGVIRVAHVAGRLREADQLNASQARLSLIRSGEWLVENLALSNCDRRLVETVSETQDMLASGENIIQLGMANIACDHVSTRMDEELGDILSARLKAYTVGITFYISQFPEWERFTENAATIDHTVADAQAATHAAKQLATSLRSVPTLIDPEVPRSIELILEAVGDPARAGKRAVFALFRTMENLVAKVFGSLTNMFGAVSDGTAAGLKRGTTAAVAAAVLGMSIVAVNAIAPGAERVVGAKWMKKAADLVKESLSKAD
ncbi:hypothetical protein NF701_04980 [Sphingomonadaceae bacterium OTU29THOMA1]|nr:hypothetical protein NF701_04980 [Sphingomonadaceae bacterium OTU29THOMA1]